MTATNADLTPMRVATLGIVKSEEFNKIPQKTLDK